MRKFAIKCLFGLCLLTCFSIASAAGYYVYENIPLVLGLN